jgi:hypothetical protein
MRYCFFLKRIGMKASFGLLNDPSAFAVNTNGSSSSGILTMVCFPFCV